MIPIEVKSPLNPANVCKPHFIKHPHLPFLGINHQKMGGLCHWVSQHDLPILPVSHDSPFFSMLNHDQAILNTSIKLIRNRQLSNLFQQRAGQTQGPCKPYGNRHTCNHLVCTSSNSHSTCSTGITRAYIQKQCLCRAFLLEKLTQYGFYCFCTLYVHS